jgi:hypothetical protein
LQQPGEIPLAHHPRHLGSRFVGRAIGALVLVSLTIGLVLVVASLSWWDFSDSNYGTVAHHLGGACYQGSCGDYTDSETLRTFFPQTYGLVLTALALSVFELVFLVLSIFWKRIAVGILVTGILGSFALLVAPIYFYFALPGAMSSGQNTHWITSFSGSFTRTISTGTVTYTWGGGAGWFTAPLVAIIFFVATIVVFFVAPHIKPFGSVRVSPS